MYEEPSDREGLRTPINSEQESEPNGASGPPTAARAALGWSLIGLALLVGFLIGTQFQGVDAADANEPAKNTRTTLAAVAAGPPASGPATPATPTTPTTQATHGEPATEDPSAEGSVGSAADSASAAEGVTTSVVETANGEIEGLDEYAAFFLHEEGESEMAVAVASDASGESGGEYQIAMAVPEYGLAALDPRRLREKDGSAMPVEELPLYNPSSAPMRRPSGTSDSLTIVTHGSIGQGQSLGSSLGAQGITASTVHLIATEMRKVFDFRHSRAGDRYRLGQDEDGRVLDFRYSQNEDESIYLAWEGTRYVVRKEATELRSQIAKIAGVVDSSFYGAIRALGEQSSLASDFARILAWDIDFSRSVHPGDEFQILYERMYRVGPDGYDEYVKPGRILAGRYEGQNGEHTVVYFEDNNGKGAYFRPDGSSVERAFLVAPLEFSRITSRFTWARRHPILKVTRPHPGIDYAAPHGTPVWAVSAGVIEYKSRAGASGNLVRIRHQNGLTSHYAHLSSFAHDLEVGDYVEQKQIIGYVGTTGLSTGPHVCFRVKRDGKYVDPMSISGPAGDPVRRERLAEFVSVRDQLLADLGSGPLGVADEAL